jgi:hypothetical protein
VLALSGPAAAQRSTPAPVVVKDAKGDAPAGSPDLTRAQLGLSSDRRLRAALTLAGDWVARDLLAGDGPPGSVCARLWTVTRPGSAPPDYLACVTSRADGETFRGSVFQTRPGN